MCSSYESFNTEHDNLIYKFYIPNEPGWQGELCDEVCVLGNHRVDIALVMGSGYNYLCCSQNATFSGNTQLVHLYKILNSNSELCDSILKFGPFLLTALEC